MFSLLLTGRRIAWTGLRIDLLVCMLCAYFHTRGSFKRIMVYCMPSKETHMGSYNRLDEIELIAALLHDVQNAHGLVFNTRSRIQTLKKIRKRVRLEGISFLTKTMPRLGKAFDKALAGNTPLNASSCRFKSAENSQLPIFLGELISRVLGPDGTLLRHPCVSCVKAVRDILYLFYKYELPYSDEQEQQVIDRFTKTEDDLSALSQSFKDLEAGWEHSTSDRRVRFNTSPTKIEVLREAKILLSDLFAKFDPTDIYPRHGPGVVATKQSLEGKYLWTNVCSRITQRYPFDAYFMASLGHVCDEYDKIPLVASLDLPARVLLVPKDSRGPRLISCEPVDFQWVQQGLGRAIVELVESHELTKFNVNFTDQGPNRRGALLGSSTGRYSTLDLNEASDRVSLDLVRLLFPPHIYEYLEACRSSSTVLPDGRVIKLKKFAPMGSSLCFPILALTTWAILTAAAPDADTREGILVYGDDVIVPTGYTVNAIEHLESFGLKVNRDKSCTSGLFRESCGMDAFQGVETTPVRLRTVWSSEPSPDVYTSWIAYANAFYDRQLYRTYEYIVGCLVDVYKSIPYKDLALQVPSLREQPYNAKPIRQRWNSSLQKLEYLVYDVKSSSVKRELPGWSSLLRYFAERGNQTNKLPDELRCEVRADHLNGQPAFSVSSYTKRKASKLVKRWR